MKTKYLYLFIMAILISGCAEDKGNYDYTPVNDIEIVGIKDNYHCMPGETLQIPVLIEQTLQESEDGLEYEWMVAEKIISHEKDLSMVIEDLKFGSNECCYTITDTKTGLKFFKMFNIVMVNNINWGYYFMTEKSDHSTVITYMPAIRDEDERKNVTFTHLSSIEGIHFGDHPREIKGSFEHFTNLGGSYWKINIMTEGGDYPFIETENATFYPNMVVNVDSYVDNDKGYKFNPKYFLMDWSKTPYYFVTDGKLVMYNSGLLYRPGLHTKDYYWSYPILAYAYSQMWAFDELSEKFYLLRPWKWTTKVISDPFAYDEALEVTFPEEDPVPSFKDHFFLGSTVEYVVLEPYTSKEDVVNIVNLLSGDANGLYMTRMTMLDVKGVSTKLDDDPARKSYPNVTGLNKNSQAVMIADDWYVSAGNKIYKSPKQALEFEEHITIPEEYGEITHIQPTAYHSALVVTTYNENSAEERKGSILFIDLKEKDTIIEFYKDVIDRCVSFLCANAGYDEAGDGK